MITPTSLLYRHDEYGVKEWRTVFKILLGLTALYSYITVASHVLFYFESGAPGANVSDYEDAFWLLQMAASTIGFGDVYPVTTGGRWTVAISFYVGVGLTSFVGVTIAARLTSFTDTAVKNRELRHLLRESLERNKRNEDLNTAILERSAANEKLNADILAHNQQLEAKLEDLLCRLEAHVRRTS